MGERCDTSNSKEKGCSGGKYEPGEVRGGWQATYNDIILLVSFTPLFFNILPCILSVCTGSEKVSASWRVLWGMCVSSWKLLLWWNCTVSGWNVEGLSLWVLYVWPGPSDLPGWRVCQSAVCSGKNWSSHHWPLPALSSELAASFLAYQQMTAHISRSFLALSLCWEVNVLVCSLWLAIGSQGFWLSVDLVRLEAQS